MPEQVDELNPLTVPVQLEVNRVTLLSITVRWTAPDLAEDVILMTTYTVTWGVDLADSNNPSTTASVPGSMTSYVITDLDTGTTYQIAVTAMSRGGTGPRSTILRVVTQSVPPLTAPIELNLGRVTTNSIAISWQPPELADGVEITAYVIYWNALSRSIVSEFSATAPTTQTSYVITGLDVQTRYQIAVAATFVVRSEYRSGGSRTEPLVEPTLRLATMVAQTISAGSQHSCTVYNGAAWCWGAGGSGRLGHGSEADSSEPVAVLTLNDGVTAIAAGGSHSCAIQDGAAKCWGNNNNGRLGDGSEMNSSEPVAVLNLNDGVTAIAAGVQSSCAIQDGIAKCWGSQGSFGVLGNGRDTSESVTAVVVSGLDGGVTAITVGINHTCAIQRSSAWCWGLGTEGQLGNNNDLSFRVPEAVSGLDGGVTAIAAGFAHSCAVVNAAARCWGRGIEGQLGNASLSTSTVSVAVQGLSSNVTAITAGELHTCAIVSAAAQCWGSDNVGQLGFGRGSSTSTVIRDPVSVDGLDSGVTAIAAGSVHSCAIHYDFIKCWGNNANGQLGNNRGTTFDAPEQVDALHPLTAPLQLEVDRVTLQSIAVRWTAADLAEDIILMTTYTVTWGVDLADSNNPSTTASIPASMTSYVITDLDNETAYQIAVTAMNRGGTGPRSTIRVVTQSVPPLTAPIGLNLGRVTTNSIAISWQPPEPVDSAEITAYIIYWNELGRGIMSELSTTVPTMQTSYVITGLEVQTRYQIAVVATFAAGSEDRLVGPRTEPLVEPTLRLATMVAQTISAGSQHSCTVYNGAAWCWGEGGSGRLGDGSEADSSEPVAVLNLNDGVTAIAAGGSHSCAIQDGAAKCWGNNNNGRLGDGSEMNSSEPVEVEGLNDGITAIAAGVQSSCAIQDGIAKCWGSQGSFGVLGNGRGTSESVTAVEVSELDDGGVTAITVGINHACAIQRGLAWCWGLGTEGQLGNASLSNSSVSVAVSGLDGGVTAITAGFAHSCAVVNAAARCWGRGSEGQLGNASLSNSSVSVAVQGLNSNVTAIAAGGLHTCVIVNAAARCWGNNSEGQLGDDSEDRSSVSVAVRGFNDGVTAIAGGGIFIDRDDSALAHSCAIHYDFIKCWGYNGNGQLGNGTFDDTIANVRPMQVQTEELNPLTAPLQLEADGVTTKSITIRWTAPDLAEGVFPITAYTVTWGVDLADSNNPSTTTSVPASMTSYVITDLDNGTVYQIAVTAMNRAGTGLRSTILRARTRSLPPTAPTALNLDRGTVNSIVIAWEPPNSTGGAAITIMEYIVYWRAVVDGTNENVFATATVLGSARSHVIKGLNTITMSYQIAVAAVNSAGLTGPRSEIFSSILSPPPRDLTLEDVTTKSIGISWRLPVSVDGMGITEYTIYWNAFGRSIAAESMTTVPAMQTNYTITGLDVKTRYHIIVAAGNHLSERSGARSTPLVGRTLGLAAMEAQAIAAGDRHSCVVYNDAAWCWGFDGRGQLGNGMAGSSTIAQQVVGLNDGITAIADGVSRSCAIQDGMAWCWGSGQGYALGDGGNSDSHKPVQVDGLNGGVTAITSGNDHSCAVQRDAAKCWGSNAFNQIGVEGQRSYPTPTTVLESGVTAIAAGNIHSCAIQNGVAKCWGNNLFGQLGIGDHASELSAPKPTTVVNLGVGVTAITAGTVHTCAIVNVAAWCWGEGGEGQLGTGADDDSRVPVQSSLNTGVTAISAGGVHTCAIVNGAAQCWGSNRSGQLGDGTTMDSNFPVGVVGLDDGVTAIAAGDRGHLFISGGDNAHSVHSCAIHHGFIKCWGYNGDGQLGNGSTANVSLAMQVQAEELNSLAGSLQLEVDEVTSQSITVRWTAPGLDANIPITGYTVSWGVDLDDRDNLETASVSTPTTSYVITGLRVGTLYQIAVTAMNRSGTGPPTILPEMTQFAPPTVPRELNLGTVTIDSIAISWEPPEPIDGVEITAYIIYWNAFGGSIASESSVTVSTTQTNYVITGLEEQARYQIEVAAVSGVLVGPRTELLVTQVLVVQTISVGVAHSCAVYNGTVWCWGAGGSGRLGNNRFSGMSPVPKAVLNLGNDVTSISAGNAHTCAIQNGVAKCWGTGANGRLGTGLTAAQFTPVAVVNLGDDVTAISAGNKHTCVIQRGAAKCWGGGEDGRLGTGSTGDSGRPTEIDRLANDVTAISAGNKHTCAIQRDLAWCWGAGDEGQLGHNSFDPSSIPVEVQGLDGSVTAIAAGGFHSCAVVGATARCWGRGSEGQLGDASEVRSSVAVTVQGLNGGVTAIAAGWLHTCAIVNGAAQCWGLNHRGQLGNDSQVQSSVAVAVQGLDDGVTEIAVGGFFSNEPFGHSCAIHYGFIKCWGSNNEGQLGVGGNSLTDANVAVDVQGLSPFAAPSELTAGVITTESITISWTAPIPRREYSDYGLYCLLGC